MISEPKSSSRHMKTLPAFILSLSLGTAFPSLAQTDVTVTAAAEPVAQPGGLQAKLPYGVDDVLKLSRAKVSEEVIFAYIDNSAIGYSLRSRDIIYLRDKGVWDRITAAMLAEEKKIAEPRPAPAPVPAYGQQPTHPVPAGEDSPPVYTQPASSLYVIPSGASSYPYYSSYYN